MNFIPQHAQAPSIIPVNQLRLLQTFDVLICKMLQFCLNLEEAHSLSHFVRIKLQFISEFVRVISTAI